MAKKKRSVDPHHVNMPELFGDLIRERSLYAVLDSLAEACISRSMHYERMLAAERSPNVRSLRQDEISFFDDAFLALQSVQSQLRAEWKDNAPSCADGDLPRARQRQSQVAREYPQSLAATLNDLGATAEDRSQAARVLAKEGAGTIWFDETGKPNFEVMTAFKGMSAAVAAPDTPEEDRVRMAAAIQEFVNR